MKELLVKLFVYFALKEIFIGFFFTLGGMIPGILCTLFPPLRKKVGKMINEFIHDIKSNEINKINKKYIPIGIFATAEKENVINENLIEALKLFCETNHSASIEDTSIRVFKKINLDDIFIGYNNFDDRYNQKIVFSAKIGVVNESYLKKVDFLDKFLDHIPKIEWCYKVNMAKVYSYLKR